MYYQKAKNPQGKWYPRSVTQGKPVSTKIIAKKLAQISTVSEADARAVLSMLGEVMADFLAAGRSVKLDGLGSFRLAGYTGKDIKAVDKPEQVTSKMFAGVRMRFVPEGERNANGVLTKAMLNGDITWNLLSDEQAAAGDAPTDEGGNQGGGSTPGGSDQGGDGTGGGGGNVSEGDGGIVM